MDASRSRPGRQPGSSMPNHRPGGIPNESYFTSFSDLGAAIPTSGEDSSATGEASTSLWSISGIKNLLHSGYSIADASSTPQDENTPLLQSERNLTKRRRARKQMSKRYVGGESAFAPIERISEVEIEEDSPLSTCRQCEAGKSPISAVKLAIISHAFFAVMSLLAEVLDRDKGGGQMNELLIVAIQASAVWIISMVALFVTGAKNALLGLPGLRGWIWARAVCAALSTILFTLASQTIPIVNLIFIVYLAPVAFNLFSTVFLSSPFPFRAQIVSVSLLLGLTLLVQPTLLFPDNQHYPALPAAPLDLAPVGDYGLDIPLPLAYLAACSSAFFTIISLGLLSRAVKINIFHSMASNSLLTALVSVTLFAFMHGREDMILPSVKQGLLLFTVVITSLLAHLFQALAFQQKSPRQLSLVSFLQPIMSTGLQTVFFDRVIDVLPLSGSMLIVANVAWVTDTLPEEEEEDEW